MDSIVQTLITYLEESVQSAIPTISKSKHYYDFNKNDSVKNNHIFAVRPSSARNTPGTIRSVTIEQDFEIEISRDYIEKSTDDSSLRNAIDEIYQDNEKIIREISLRRTTLQNILFIGQPSFERPEVNENQKSVSITFTYPVTYRKSIKGDS